MRRRQERGLHPTGGDWFGRCGGWQAATIAALEPRKLYVGASWGKIVLCAISDNTDPVCLVVTREVAERMLIDLQLALAQ